jgi:hypothetical protein
MSHHRIIVNVNNVTYRVLEIPVVVVVVVVCTIRDQYFLSELLSVELLFGFLFVFGDDLMMMVCRQ